MRARYIVPAFAAAAALLLTGCVDNSTPAATTPPGEVSTIEADAAAVALLPDDIKSAGVLVIGTDAAYPPNEFKDESGAPIGWGIELASGIAAKLGLTTKYQIASFDNIIPSITGGTVDIGESSFTDNLEREQQVDFVNYYNAGILWAAPVGSTVDPDNACGLTVAVQDNTVEDTDELPAKSDACVAAGKEKIEILPYGSQDEATNAVVLGKADALSADSPVTLYAISKAEGELQPAGESFDTAPYGITVDKGSELTAAVQAALQSMVDDGSYAKILDAWGVTDGGIDTITINAASNG
ncbi:ABC transporter substrate-binding protein [Cryobacterium sp. TMT1-3]|uniref:ABC transporter substrate-binding protein n=1 Tax=Cryobacterium luteum TaxID=1424661 RepID=A0A1H8J1S7_9MICO|nr:MULTISPECIES: ABC transporter substrate-binding protein [Cryobacterium]TFB93293.1 ABC transporter substrate-binding protein [Cryobacterium luteum]TFC28734.1 ABC transporter substrate-binding protein [Cryobacterium sp. TMT1-3]SEN74920.1 amino acid ABC transporter substrate-binding protein, PAAT family [Cryobacterium luteum]